MMLLHSLRESCLCWAVGSLFVAVPSVAQPAPVVRTFHTSKAAVQRALHDIPSYPGGKLPMLDGFADGESQSLASYKRGHYDYDVQLRSATADTTTVLITAKITAWYTAASAANSGYRVLKSNGRLETDLMDALDERLNPASAGKIAISALPGSATRTLPDSPSSTGGGKPWFNMPRPTTAPSTSAPPPTPAPSKVVNAKTAKRLQELGQQAENLEQILKSQVRPDNLAVVKSMNTPVTSQPVDGAEMLFRADAEDEFEVLDTTQGWVHVKISGISRGWIRQDYVDLPGAATVSVAALGDETRDEELVRQTKEEVGAFPGKWEPLDGKQVKIIWVQPREKDQFGSESRFALLKPLFRKVDAGNPTDTSGIAGVVVILDSEDGGMAATTLANLQQWRAGHLSDDAFWKRCWRDSSDNPQGRN